MIIFDLACGQEHPFEGWFQSSADYDSQLGRGLISCPHCGSTAIRRVPSAPHLTKSTSTAAAASAPPKTKPAAVASGATEALQQAFLHVLAAVVANSEDVGSDFAAEARKIHYLEAPQRAIRGQASSDDYEELRDEGIDVVRLPEIKKH